MPSRTIFLDALPGDSVWIRQRSVAGTATAEEAVVKRVVIIDGHNQLYHLSNGEVRRGDDLYDSRAKAVENWPAIGTK